MRSSIRESVVVWSVCLISDMTIRQFNKTREKLKEIVDDWGKGKVYLVGGCVRDILLNKPSHDIDLCIDYPDGATEFCKYLEKNGLAKDFVVYPRFGTSKFTLIDPEVPIECVIPRVETYNSGPRKPDSVEYSSIMEDAKRRDFCCNALYLDLQTGEILDPTGHGKEDIQNKILRTPLDPEITFKDDPLRMLRALRFTSTLEFTILPEVLEKIKPYPEYYKLSMERVRDEFDKIICSIHPIETIRLLHETKLLEYVIPEFEESWGFNQNSKYHSMNLTDHSLEVLRYACRDSRYDNSNKLRLAALLHDIAKYKCWTTNTRGEFSYHGHEAKSAEMAEKILTRLKYPGELIHDVSEIIRNHMIIKKFYDPVTDSYTGTDAQTRKIIRTLGDYLRDTMIIIDADNKSHAPSYNMPGQVKSFYEKLVDLKKGVDLVRVCPVSGDIIMKELNLKPGPTIKEIKEIFLEWLDERPELTEEELIAKYKKTYPDNEYFWIWKDMSRQESSLLTLGKPTEYGSTYSAPIHEVPFELEYSRGVTQEVQQWKASEHPDLYRRLLRYREVWDIVDKVGQDLGRMFKIKGFESINLVFDSDYDLSATIKWTDEKPTYII